MAGWWPRARRGPLRVRRSRRCSQTSCSTTSTGSWNGAGIGFVRYADDGRIYLRSERAGRRVMASITHYVEQRLKLRVNRQKSAVAPAVERPLLGFEFFRDKAGKVRVTVAPKALKRAQDRICGSPGVRFPRATRPDEFGVLLSAPGQGGGDPQATRPGDQDARGADGQVIPQGRPTGLWVRWWSRIRFTRCWVSGLRFCMCVVSRPVGCMCVMGAGGGTSRWMRRRPIAAWSRPSGR